MKARCPKDQTHKRFVTTAHEMHDWVVDEHGEFVADLGCIQVDHGADVGNIWGCKECGSEAIVED